MGIYMKAYIIVIGILIACLVGFYYYLESTKEEPVIIKYVCHTNRAYGVEFVHPEGWTVKPGAQHRTLVLECPEMEADWHARVTFDKLPYQYKYGLDNLVSERVKSLGQRKPNCRLIARKKFACTRGMGGVMLEYTYTLNGIPVTEREAYIPYTPKGNTLMVVTPVTARFMNAKYIPMFDTIIRSIRKPDTAR